MTTFPYLLPIIPGILSASWPTKDNWKWTKRLMLCINTTLWLTNLHISCVIKCTVEKTQHMADKVAIVVKPIANKWVFRGYLRKLCEHKWVWNVTMTTLWMATTTHCNTEEFSDNYQNISPERGELGEKRLYQMHVKGKMSEIILPKDHKKP